MHIIAAAILAAVLQATPPPSAAPAASTAPGTVPAATAPGATVPAGTATGQPNFGQVISSVNNAGGAVAKVRALNGSTVTTIRPVNVAQLSGANPSALSNAVARNQRQVTQLRNSLSTVTVTTNSNAHITLAQFLADNKISVAQVVGADVQNGTLLLYYQKP